MFRFLFFIITLGVICVGGYFLYEQKDELMRYTHEFRKPSKIYTLEASFTPEEITTLRQKELLREKEYSFSKAETLFVPYILYDVKFVNNNKQTEESRLLFSLVTGEMILDTRTFDTTHGFEDCIIAGATEEDFRLLHLLENQGGQMTRETLAHKLSIDPEDLSGRLEALRKKHLIAIKGDTIRIHFQNPLLHVIPQTKLTQPVVLKEVLPNQLLSARYSKGQINKIIKAAFGQDFAIRKEIELFIPVIEIEVLMKDCSIHKTYWNGITGKSIDMSQ